MKRLPLLLDLAQQKTGSDAELARRLEVPRQIVSEWRHEKRAISPEAVAALCDLLRLSGEEAREWLAIAVCDNPKNANRAEMLKRALFGCWVAGVVALCSPNDAQAGQQAYKPATNTLYIAHWLRQAARRALAAFSRIARPWTSRLDARRRYAPSPAPF